MKRIAISQLQPAPRMESLFMLQEVELKNKKNGDPFASMKFVDATGSLAGVMWDNLGAILNHQVAAEDFVRVSGEVQVYGNALQVVVKDIRKVPDDQVDMRDFIPHTPKDIKELVRLLDARIAEVKHRDCRRLLDYFLGAGPHSVRDAYCAAPASVRVHQAYVGGLLEHTLAVLHNALLLAEQYPPVNRDVLITGGLLHDMGKIREYDWRRVLRYTDEGRLVGHISIASGMLMQAYRDLAPFDELLGWNIQHLVLSHHGKLEYGSPVLPKTREALLLHYGDVSDAFLFAYIEEVDKAQAQGLSWTPYSKLFSSYMYAGPTAESPAAAGQSAPARRPAGRPTAAGDLFSPPPTGGGDVDDPGY